MAGYFACEEIHLDGAMQPHITGWMREQRAVEPGRREALNLTDSYFCIGVALPPFSARVFLDLEQFDSVSPLRVLIARTQVGENLHVLLFAVRH